jgi:5-methyltetrahydropteroyltriglutamate--homocysteine methyltransferase
MSTQIHSTLDTIRVDHIGSLVRPRALLEMHAILDRREATEDDLRRAEDDAIREVVSQQEAIGFPVVNDGEFRRRNFQDSFGAAVSGFDAPGQAADYRRWREENRSTRSERVMSGPAVAGPPVATRRAAVQRLQLTRNLPLEEYRFAAGVSHTPVKATLIGPDRISQRFDYQGSGGVYDGLDDFTGHVAEIEHQMVRQLVDAGCPYVQIDAPGYTAYVDPPSLETMRARGEDPDENMMRSIKADNAVIEGFPGVTFGIHLCRGNSRGIDPATGRFVAQWHREGNYDAIAERLFNGLKHKRLLLEYDSERAGSFESLRFVPKDKIVVLGLVTTKSTDIESADFLIRRIEEATRYIPIEQLALSPQCGFGSSAAESIPAEAQWKKLELILETAVRVWG